MKPNFKLKPKNTALRLFLSFAILLLSISSIAQVITGRISDSTGSPLSDVSIKVKGTGRGTITNGQGIFSINASKGEVIEFSMTGFETVSITIADQTSLNIILKTEVKTLDEVIMIGYGYTTAEKTVAAINKISGKNFANSSAIMPAELIQGKAAGVQVIRRNGQPGINVHIMIRGSGSFTSLEPLYVIDGIRSEGYIFNALLPQDIESITILKDASSTAIYGANGANGVVLITTKKGRPNSPPVVSFSTQWGVGLPPKKYELMNAAQYLELAKEYKNPLPSNFRGTAVDGVDWQDQIFRNAILTTNHVGISGGSEKVVYNVAIGYTDHESVLRDYRFRAANLRVSLQETLGIFKIGQDLNLQYQHMTGGNSPGTIRSAIAMPPYLNVYDAQGDLTAPDETDLFDEDNQVRNPITSLLTRKHTDRYFILNPQFFGEVNISKSLNIRSQISLKYTGQSLSNFQTGYYTAFDPEVETEAEEQQYNAIGYLLENYATWTKSFGRHHIVLTAGNSYVDKGRGSLLVAEAEEYPNNSISNISVALNPQVHEATAGYANPSEISYFGRLAYSFNNKYILSASLRRDASSIFGEGNKFGNFPSFGGAWNADREKFIQKIKAISELKLRASWGKTGNSNGDPFQTSQTLYNGIHAGTLIASLGEDEDFYNGITVTRFPNPLLKWEETVQTDAGIDLGLFNNKLILTVDWYKRQNNDLLVDVPVPNSTGTGSPNGDGTILSNAASVVNQGVEVQLTYSKKVNNHFNYSLGVNGAYNKNKVVSIGSEFLGEIKGGYVDDDLPVTITHAGDPIGSFFALKVDHVDEATGDFVFKDINNDGEINDDDKVILGNPIPKYVFGGNLEVGYRNFDLNILLSGTTGLKLYNDVKSTLMSADRIHNVSAELVNRWKKPGDKTQYPAAFHPDEKNFQPSDFYIEDGSFMRVKAMTIGYTLPLSALKQFCKGAIKNFRFYISAENLLTFTSYSGYDPEVSRINGDIIFSRGIDLGQIPQQKSFLAGIQMNF